MITTKITLNYLQSAFSRKSLPDFMWKLSETDAPKQEECAASITPRIASVSPIEQESIIWRLRRQSTQLTSAMRWNIKIIQRFTRLLLHNTMCLLFSSIFILLSWENDQSALTSPLWCYRLTFYLFNMGESRQVFFEWHKYICRLVRRIVSLMLSLKQESCE